MDPNKNNSNRSQNIVAGSKKVRTLKGDLAEIQQQAKEKIESPISKPLSNITGIPRVTPVPGPQYTLHVPRPLSAWQNQDDAARQESDLIAPKNVFGPSKESFAEPQEKTERDATQNNRQQKPTASGAYIEVNPFADQNQKQTQAPAKHIISPIETFTNDVANNVNKEHTSLATIAIAESNRKAKQGDENKNGTGERGLNTAGKNVLIIIFSLLFLGLGIGAVYYFIVLHSLSSQKISAAEQSKDIIQSEIQTTLSLTGLSHSQFIQSIQSLIASAAIQNGQIEHVTLSYGSTTAMTQDLFSLLETDAPTALIRTLNGPFYFGLNNTDNGNEPFLIFTTDSYSDTEGGMLEWEPTMIADLQDIFLKTQDRVSSQENYSFQDVLIDNKEVRLVENTQGQIVFLYSLIDQNTLIIANNQFTFEELLNRLDSANFVR